MSNTRDALGFTQEERHAANGPTTNNRSNTTLSGEEIPPSVRALYTPEAIESERRQRANDASVAEAIRNNLQGKIVLDPPVAPNEKQKAIEDAALAAAMAGVVPPPPLQPLTPNGKVPPPPPVVNEETGSTGTPWTTAATKKAAKAPEAPKVPEAPKA